MTIDQLKFSNSKGLLPKTRQCLITLAKEPGEDEARTFKADMVNVSYLEDMLEPECWMTIYGEVYALKIILNSTVASKAQAWIKTGEEMGLSHKNDHFDNYMEKWFRENHHRKYFSVDHPKKFYDIVIDTMPVIKVSDIHED